MKKPESTPISLYLSSGIHFELTHQLVLQKLLPTPAFAKALLGIEGEEITLQRECWGKLFDLGVLDAAKNPLCAIEIKVWTGINEDQIKKQGKEATKRNIRTCFYLLLGPTDFEWQGEDDHRIQQLQTATDGSVTLRKLGHENLIAALDQAMHAFEQPVQHGLATSYRNALQQEHQRLLNAWSCKKEREKKSHACNYSVYYHIQQLLPDLHTHIRVTGSSSQCTLTATAASRQFKVGAAAFELRLEWVDGVLKIRAHALDNTLRKDKTQSRKIREQLRATAHELLQRCPPRSLEWDDKARLSRHTVLAQEKEPLKFEDNADFAIAAGRMREAVGVMAELGEELGRLGKDLLPLA